MTYRKKLIEVALPLEAINIASAREMNAGSDAGAEKETPPQGRRRAGDAISGGVKVYIINIQPGTVNGQSELPRGAI